MGLEVQTGILRNVCAGGLDRVRQRAETVCLIQAVLDTWDHAQRDHLMQHRTCGADRSAVVSVSLPERRRIIPMPFTPGPAGGPETAGRRGLPIWEEVRADTGPTQQNKNFVELEGGGAAIFRVPARFGPFSAGWAA